MGYGSLAARGAETLAAATNQEKLDSPFQDRFFSGFS